MERKQEKLSDVYPLSAIQQLTLLDALATQDGSVRFDYVAFTMKGDIDLNDIEGAWQAVLMRHPALRSVLLWKGLRQPVQVVRGNVRLPFEIVDLSAHDDAGKRAGVDAYMRRNHDDGLSLSKAPPLRVACCLFAPDVVRIVVSYSPCLLDGWSTALAVREFFAIYEAHREGVKASLPPAKPFRDYLSWLKRQDVTSASTFWRKTLSGLTEPTRLPVDRLAASTLSDREPSYIEEHLDSSDVDALTACAQALRVTTNTIVQASWSLLLAAYSESRDIVFGTAISGRPGDLPEMETVVGVFFNNLPVRVRTDPDQSIAEWLRGIQRNLSEQSKYGYLSLPAIHEASGFDAGAPLFHSIVLFHNFPLKGTFWDDERKFHTSEIQKPIRTNFPLTLVYVPDFKYRVQIIYDAALWKETSARKLLEDQIALLNALTQHSDSTIGDVMNAITPSHFDEWLVKPVQRRAQRPSAAGDKMPESEIEQTIAKIWTDVIGISRIGVHDNFFDLGGRSVHLAIVCERLQLALGRQISLIDTFEHPTVAKLAEWLNSDAPKSANAADIADKAEQRRSNQARRRRRLQGSALTHD